MALSLELTRAKSGLWLITVTDSTGAAQNLSGMTLYFHAAGVVDIDKSSPSGGIVITNATGGLATLQLDPADTADIPAGGDFEIPCELTLVNGASDYEIAKGNLFITSNVGAP